MPSKFSSAAVAALVVALAASQNNVDALPFFGGIGFSKHISIGGGSFPIHGEKSIVIGGGHPVHHSVQRVNYDRHDGYDRDDDNDYHHNGYVNDHDNDYDNNNYHDNGNDDYRNDHKADRDDYPRNHVAHNDHKNKDQHKPEHVNAKVTANYDTKNNNNSQGYDTQNKSNGASKLSFGFAGIAFLAAALNFF
jgi:hypothetical protein